MESQITVSRTSPDDVQLRQIIVKLNGERIAELMYGQSVTRAMAQDITSCVWTTPGTGKRWNSTSPQARS